VPYRVDSEAGLILLKMRCGHEQNGPDSLGVDNDGHGSLGQDTSGAGISGELETCTPALRLDYITLRWFVREPSQKRQSRNLMACHERAVSREKKRWAWGGPVYRTFVFWSTHTSTRDEPAMFHAYVPSIRSWPPSRGKPFSKQI